jgi:hypothetical protein
MARHIFRPSGKLFLFILSACGIACFSVSALAQNVAAGCNQQVWKALSAKADAQVAYDVAVTRQLINKPDSVLTLTCFDQAAGVSAKNGGAIFSGDFTTQLQTIMPVNGGGAFKCNEIGLLWNTIATEGINTGAPYATFDDLENGTLPTLNAGADFKAGWGAAATAGVFQALDKAVTALPLPPATMSFAGDKSSCDVLFTAGIITTACPQPQP